MKKETHMTTKTTEPAPSTETPQTSGGCCGGKGHGKPAPEPESRDTAPGAKAGAKPGGCGCGN